MRAVLCRLAWSPLSTCTSATRKYSPRGRQLPENPGIGRRVKFFEEQGEAFSDELDDPDDFQSDFMSTQTIHKQAQAELTRHKESLGRWVVQNKYFKSHHLNLLTYAEKEQIRHLHDTDREEWPAEKLAASFPATEETIQKIIRAKWVLREAKGMKEHDRAVQRNWDKLKQGPLPGMDEGLRKHLLGFADRQIEQLPRPAEVTRNLPELPHGEFSNIITSCKQVQKTTSTSTSLALKSGRDTGNDAPQERPKYGSNTMVLQGEGGGVPDHRPMTIELFRDSSGMLQPAKETSVDSHRSEVPAALGVRPDKVEMRPVPSQFDANQKNKFRVPRDQITIPRKLWRSGATYKVEDSYFADDGEFLYSVPGMSK